MINSEARKKQQEVALNVLDQGGTGTEEQQLPYPALPPVVFPSLEQTKKPRSWCLRITHSPWLNYLSRLMVVLSCVTLCMYKPHEEQNFYLEIWEGFTLAFFIVEMVTKMVALGVDGYLRNQWNKFDVFISFGEMLDYILGCYSLRWQVFQALRPMRLLGRLQSLRVLVAVLVDTLPMLANVLFLNMLVVHIFSIVGVQLWAGQLRNRCFLGEDIPTEYNVSLNPYYITKFGAKKAFICSSDEENGMQSCSDIPPFRVDGETCTLDASNHTSNERSPAVSGTGGCVNWNQYYNVCRAGDNNPYGGAINFDNIGYSWITVFQMLTLEGWAEIMFYVMDAHSYWNVLFFVFATIMGAIVMRNVCAVVIATNFSENMGRKTEEQSAGAVTVAGLFRKVIFWVQRVCCRRNRNPSKVSPESKDGGVNPLGLIWTPCKKILKRTVESQLFDRLIMFAVVLSIVALAVEHHDQPKTLTRVLGISDTIFGVIFFVEMTLKLLVLKGEYFKDQENIIDFVIVVTSVYEAISQAKSKQLILRSLRLLRFVRLLKFLPYLQRQLLVLKKTTEKAAGLCILLLCFTLSFSILGMLLFGGKFQFETKPGNTVNARKNFDTIHWSMVTVFEIFTQDGWNLVLYSAIAARSAWATVYFVVLIMLGNHVLLNALVGIVIESFRGISDPSDSSSDSDTPQINDNKNDHPSSDSGPSRSSVTDPAPKRHRALPDITPDNESLTLIQRIIRWCKKHEDWSFYVLSPQNRFRVFCQRVIAHSMFDPLVLLFILLSCVTIAVERPGIDHKSTERFILKLSLYVFSSIFLVEMLLKVLAMGLFFGKNSYCRSLWNAIDGLLVILSLVHVFVSLVGTGNTNMLSILKVLRLLRAFRSLRVIKRAPKLKLAVEALIASAKPIGNIILICCALFFFFAILGVQLFKGKFFYCLGQDITNITTKKDCLAAGNQWIRKTFNFDSVPQALLSLFVMYSKNGWMNIMYDGLDAVGVDRQPVKNYNEWMLLYFVGFMIMSFFLLDMFIGIMVETFHECQQEQRKVDDLLLQEAGEKPEQHREPEEVPYFANYSRLRRLIHTLCTSRFLDLFVTSIIFLSVLVMAVEHYNQPQYVEQVTEYSFYVFTAIFIIEVLLKLVAFGVLRFMKDRWNLLDVLVVLISSLTIVFNEMKMSTNIPINPSILRICRVLRLSQVLKTKRIRVLLNTILRTLSQVGNICLLFMFFFFIYAALGVELFGKLECTEDYPCLGLHRYANFRNFGTALLTLYKVCTGDNWSVILKDTLRECPPGADGCPSYLSWASPIYFISFVIMAQFVLINLVVAAIMQALEDSTQEEERRKGRKTGPVPAKSTQKSPARDELNSLV